MIPRREAQQFGPYVLRDGKVLDQALTLLKDANRVRTVKDGSRIDIHVNPAILG